jgi:hypothetical protein
MSFKICIIYQISEWRNDGDKKEGRYFTDGAGEKRSSRRVFIDKLEWKGPQKT